MMSRMIMMMKKELSSKRDNGGSSPAVSDAAALVCMFAPFPFLAGMAQKYTQNVPLKTGVSTGSTGFARDFLVRGDDHVAILGGGHKLLLPLLTLCFCLLSCLLSRIEIMTSRHIGRCCGVTAADAAV